MLNRVWIFVAAFGLLGIAAVLVLQAASMAPSKDGFTGPITHHAPTDAFVLGPQDAPPVPDFEDKVQNGFSSGGELKAGEAKTDSFPLEGSVQAFIFVAYPAGQIELQVTSPSGKTYGTGQPSSPGNQVEKSEEGLFGLFPGHTVYLGIDKAEAGMWKARVTVTSAPDTLPKVPYLLGTMIAPGEHGGGVTIKNLTKGRTYHIGEAAALRASVHDGTTPLPDAQVIAYVPFDPTKPTPVTLRDDGRVPDSSAGDGVYAGLTPKFTRPGNPYYSIRATRAHAPGRPGFEHVTGGMLSIARSRSHWTGRFRDYGVDTSKDGQFDSLIVLAEIEVTDSCQVGGYAVLTDSSGGSHTVSFSYLRLAPGKHAIPFEFDGEEIFEAGHRGPYTISDIRLSEEDDEGQIALLDQLRNAYRTQAYGLNAFQRDSR
ncbi:MAG TPA: choice-of-anchor X domain-containing protein [Candidatus Eisenbacteria bacterium]|jgi:hypothetical protein|nr:choice-of-anchor X domain-containing protein [Candidatus Eisenbacteria bacterium]